MLVHIGYRLPAMLLYEDVFVANPLSIGNLLFRSDQLRFRAICFLRLTRLLPSFTQTLSRGFRHASLVALRSRFRPAVKAMNIPVFSFLRCRNPLVFRRFLHRSLCFMMLCSGLSGVHYPLTITT